MPWWAWLLVGLWAAGATLAVVLARAAALGDRDLDVGGGTSDAWADEQYLEVLVAEACAALRADRGVLLLHGEAGADELVVVAEHGTGGTWRGQRVSAQPAGVAALLSSGQDAVQDVASAQIVVGGRPRGRLAVASVAPRRRFAERDLQTLAMLADRCAAVLAGESPEDPGPALPRGPERAKALAQLAGDVAQRLGLDAEGRTEVQLAAVLHGIGELRFWRPETSPGMPLTGAVAQLRDERWDGSGPQRVAGERIPLGSRILAACDVWLDALTDVDRAAAVTAVRREAGRRLDPAVADALLAVVGARPGRFRTVRDATQRRH